MKKLIFLVIALLLVPCTARTEGYLGLYTDETAADCDFAPIMFAPFDVHLLYIRELTGPDGITAFEFMLEKHSDYINITIVTWPPGFVPYGSIETGISVATPGCYGAGLDIVPLGTIQMFSTSALLSPDDYVRIVADPTAIDPGIWVATCEVGFPLHEVLGHWFKFIEGTCSLISAEPTSWGAIKSMISE